MSEDAKMFGDTDDAALFGDAPAPRKSKQPMPTRMSRDPARKGQPESGQEELERLGEDTGPQKVLRVPGVGGIIEGEPMPVGTAARRQWMDETVGGIQRVENAAGTAAVGGLAGAATKGALAARAGGSAGVAGNAAKVIEQAIENSFAHGNIFGTAAKLFPGAASTVVNAATKALPNAVGATAGAGTVAAATAAPQIANQAIRGEGTMSNAIERLRASAAGNPRAAELMSKIDAMRTLPDQPAFPAPVATGTVTQGTLGGHE